MSKFTKIENGNLDEHAGKKASLYCQVGVVLSVHGKIENGCGLCRYGVRLDNDVAIGFSFGQFRTLPSGELEIQVF